MKISESKIISIGLVTYNRPDFIKDAVYSVLNQSYSNLQIILVNDGSKDNCADICDHYSKLDPRIIVIHKRLPYVVESNTFNMPPNQLHFH